MDKPERTPPDMVDAIFAVANTRDLLAEGLQDLVRVVRQADSWLGDIRREVDVCARTLEMVVHTLEGLRRSHRSCEWDAEWAPNACNCGAAEQNEIIDECLFLIAAAHGGQPWELTGRTHG